MSVCSGSRLAANRESSVCYLRGSLHSLTSAGLYGESSVASELNPDQHGVVNYGPECIFDGVQTETLPKSALPSSKPKLHLKRLINHSTSKLIGEYRGSLDALYWIAR